MKNNFLKQYFGFIFLFCMLFACNRPSTEEEVPEENPNLYLFGICIDSLDVVEYKIQSGENLSIIFSKLGFSASTTEQICKVSSHVLDPKRIMAGKDYFVFSTQDSLADIRYIVFANSSTHFAVIDMSVQDSIKAYLHEKQVIYKEEYAQGIIRSSLWNAITNDGGDPMLALMLSDIYAWEIDFFDIKEGDAFKVIYEVAYIDDTVALAIENIKGAIFSHKGIDYHAIPFIQDSVWEYFDIEGNSLRRAFLKAPLDFFRITSRYSNSRFHPVLKRYRAHHGVDYAAPVGTPVKTIGDGTVIAKGYQSGGGGNFVKIKHNSTYTTVYMHLKGFAKGINQGSRVQQGQVIGYVGSTGLSTGPHLDFRVYKNGSPIDPLKLESPPSHPVKKELMPQYDSMKHEILTKIETFSKGYHPKDSI
jgi:murein DD-endopeptidase MepM/ murein hydrolase activator NlpD